MKLKKYIPVFISFLLIILVFFLANNNKNIEKSYEEAGGEDNSKEYVQDTISPETGEDIINIEDEDIPLGTVNNKPNKNKKNTTTNNKSLDNANKDLSYQSNEVPETGLYLNSVKELKSSNLGKGEIVNTRGYYEPADGGNGTYRIVEDNSLKDNGGTIIKLDNGLKAQLIITNETVSVKQFGAKGDGIKCEAELLNIALNSGIKNVVITRGNYKLTGRITINTSGTTVIGDGSTLFTDNDYKDSFEWVFNIRGNDITIKDFTMKAQEVIPVGYTSQVGVANSSRIKIYNCKFIIPETAPSKKTDGSKLGYSNIDLYTGWNDVTIEKCILKVLHDGEIGCCIMARDFLGNPSAGLIFKNNECYKICHDEILFIAGKNGTVKDVNISGNKFVMDNKNASVSNVCFSLGTTDAKEVSDITFEDNIINCKSDYTLITFGKSSNVSVKNNDITYTKAGIKKGSIVFTDDSSKNTQIENNRIILKSDSEEGIGGLNSSKGSLINNTVIAYCDITGALFSSKTAKVQKNTITTNGELGMIGDSLYNFINNTVVINGRLYKMFQYYDCTLKSDVNINDNIINYNYRENKTMATPLLMVNKSMLNDYIIRLTGNVITAPYTSTGSSLYYISIQDDSEQAVIFKENNVTGFTKTYGSENKMLKITVLNK